MKTLGKFEILDRVGQGAMGVVYKARDPLIGRLVALKTITTGLDEDPALLERFYHEAHSAGALQHPNIVTIYELGEEDHTPFIAMEYLTGQSLDKLIEGHHELPLSQRIGYIAYVCRALAYAHKQGVVHRDIKPANVMVTTDGTVKVVDFGIARIAENSKSQTGLVIGTLGYMSPQQIEGGRADARSDIWAAGILFYELLAYRRPFDGDNYGALMLNIIKKDLPPLSETAPGTPADVSHVVELMLRKEISERFQSMEEVLIELEPVWRRMQHGEVSGLLAASREKLQAGQVAIAFEMARRVLQIDTANAEAKALLEQISAETRRTKSAPAPPANPKDDETYVGSASELAAPSPVRPPAVASEKKASGQTGSIRGWDSRFLAAETKQRVEPPADVRPAVPIPATAAKKQPVAIAALVLLGIVLAGGGTYFFTRPSKPPFETAATANTPAPSAASPVRDSDPVSRPGTPIDTGNRPQGAAANSPGNTSRSQDTAASTTKPSNTPAQQQAVNQGSSAPAAIPANPATISPPDRTVVAANNPVPAPITTQPAAVAAQPVVQPSPPPVVAAPAPKAAEPVPAAVPVAPPVKAAEPAAVSSADNLDKQQITVALQQVTAAYSHRSIDEVVELYPKIPKDERNNLKNIFGSVKSISRKFNLQSLNVSADGARATAIGTYDDSYQIGGAKETLQSGNFYVRFAKKNGRWYIDEWGF